MPYTFTLTATIPASPQEIYEAWLDSLGHSEMTGGEASMSDEVGAEVSAWDGYISGRNLELIPGERIVQTWRTSEFADEHEDSVISIVLTEVGDGTLLTLEHSNVPDDHRSYEEGGWQSNYFEPMVAYFTGLRGVGPSDRPEPAARQSAPKAPPKRARKRPAKTARKAKPATKTKSKRAVPRAKTAKRKSRVKQQIVGSLLRSFAKTQSERHANRPAANGNKGCARLPSVERELAQVKIFIEPKPRVCARLSSPAGVEAGPPNSREKKSPPPPPLKPPRPPKNDDCSGMARSSRRTTFSFRSIGISATLRSSLLRMANSSLSRP